MGLSSINSRHYRLSFCDSWNNQFRSDDMAQIKCTKTCEKIECNKGRYHNPYVWCEIQEKYIHLNDAKQCTQNPQPLYISRRKM